MDSLKSQAGVPTVCYVTQADSSVVQVEVEHRARGQEVLDKMCRMLGITDESEYFGMQFIGAKNEMMWLNNRNRISRQISSQPPYHLYFRVKYFVPPEDILLESTRVQFYQNVVFHLKTGLWDAETTLSIQAHLIALMAFVQFGPYNPNTTPCKYACFWPDSRGEIPAEAIRSAASFHRTLDSSSIPHAQYDLLRTVNLDVPFYGMTFFDVKDIFERRYLLGVGPQNIVLCNSNNTVNERFPYCRVHTITTSSRVVTLNLLEDDGSVKGRNYQLASPRLASALYRAVTEVYAFFHCDSVRKEVILQTRKDLKDAITFHYNAGKDYAFDVRYTFREVCDRTRRNLYRCAHNLTPQGSPPESCSFQPASMNNDFSSDSQKASGDAVGHGKHELSTRANSLMNDEELLEIVQKYISELTLCRVCMDASVSRVFIPCGHIICCAECADRLEQCSICRKPIEIRHPCFLPWNTDLSSVSQMRIGGRCVRRFSARSEITPPTSTTFDKLFPHTSSAPTCHLFSLPSAHCLNSPVTSSLPVNTSPSTITSVLHQSVSEPQTIDTGCTQVATTSDCLDDSTTSETERVHSHEPQSFSSQDDNAVPTSSTFVPTSRSDDTTVETGDSTTGVPHRRPVHISWQLTE